MTQGFVYDGTFDPSKHVPKKADTPDEGDESASDRPDIEPACAFAKGAVVTHARTKERGVVHRMDFITRQIRLWYPARAEAGMELADQFDTRTNWQSFDDWIPEIELHPDEVARRNAKEAFNLELQNVDPDDMGLVTVFCEDADPIKALRKLQALKKKGLVNIVTALAEAKAEVVSTPAAQMPAEPVPPAKQRFTKRKADGNGEEGSGSGGS